MSKSGNEANEISRNKTIVKFVVHRFTIANISAVIALIFSLRYFIYPDGMGWSFVFGVGLLVYCVIIIAIDFIVKSITRKFWLINLIEIMIILFIVYLVIY